MALLTCLDLEQRTETMEGPRPLSDAPRGKNRGRTVATSINNYVMAYRDPCRNSA